MRGGDLRAAYACACGIDIGATVKSDNTVKTDKRKAPKTAWKKGQSGNPHGAPKRGESWREIIDSIGNMTGQEVSKIAGAMSRDFARLPENVTLKQLVIMRTYAQMINEPSPGLLTALMERTDGKVTQPIGNDNTGALILKIVRAGSGSADHDQ